MFIERGTTLEDIALIDEGKLRLNTLMMIVTISDEQLQRCIDIIQSQKRCGEVDFKTKAEIVIFAEENCDGDYELGTYEIV
jgi:hypothetical protein